MPTYICSENASHWGAGATREMLSRNIYVADIGRSNTKGSRTTIYVDGEERNVIKTAHARLEGLRPGDTLQMLVRTEKAIYVAQVTGRAIYRVVNTHEHKEGQFYSHPSVIAARRGDKPAEGYGGLAGGLQLEVQVPVSGWRRTTLPVEKQPYATIQRA